MALWSAGGTDCTAADNFTRLFTSVSQNIHTNNYTTLTSVHLFVVVVTSKHIFSFIFWCFRIWIWQTCSSVNVIDSLVLWCFWVWQNFSSINPTGWYVFSRCSGFWRNQTKRIPYMISLFAYTNIFHLEQKNQPDSFRISGRCRTAFAEARSSLWSPALLVLAGNHKPKCIITYLSLYLNFPLLLLYLVKVIAKQLLYRKNNVK